MDAPAVGPDAVAAAVRHIRQYLETHDTHWMRKLKGLQSLFETIRDRPDELDENGLDGNSLTGDIARERRAISHREDTVAEYRRVLLDILEAEWGPVRSAIATAAAAAAAAEAAQDVDSDDHLEPAEDGILEVFVNPQPIVMEPNAGAIADAIAGPEPVMMDPDADGILEVFVNPQPIVMEPNAGAIADAIADPEPVMMDPVAGAIPDDIANPQPDMMMDWENEQNVPLPVGPEILLADPEPKAQLHALYRQYRLSIIAADYHTSYVGPVHAPRWTSTFTCPKTGLEFLTRPYGANRECVEIDNLIWYTRKSWAEHGAAANAFVFLSANAALLN